MLERKKVDEDDDQADKVIMTQLMSSISIWDVVVLFLDDGEDQNKKAKTLQMLGIMLLFY